MPWTRVRSCSIVPAGRYRPSPRVLAGPPPWPYDPDDQVRSVQRGGWLYFRDRRLHLPKAFRGRRVAFRPAATDGCWDVIFMTHRLRTIDLGRDPKSANV